MIKTVRRKRLNVTLCSEYKACPMDGQLVAKTGLETTEHARHSQGALVTHLPIDSEMLFTLR